MSETLRQSIRRLISLYETEKSERARLESELEKAQMQNETCKEQITELKKEIDNRMLKQAFMANRSANTQARKQIDKLIKEIDRCISLMEG